MEPDGSELRAAFDEWIRREIGRIESEPARAAEIGAALRRVLAHETVRAWEERFAPLLTARMKASLPTVTRRPSPALSHRTGLALS